MDRLRCVELGREEDRRDSERPNPFFFVGYSFDRDISRVLSTYFPLSALSSFLWHGHNLGRSRRVTFEAFCLRWGGHTYIRMNSYTFKVSYLSSCLYCSHVLAYKD